MTNIGVWAVSVAAILLLLAFGTDAKVTVGARHVQVKTLAEAEDVLKRTEDERLEDIAEKTSLCPTKKRGGNLGRFSRNRNELPPRLSGLADYIFTDPPPRVGAILGPAKTKLGYHIIEITDYVDDEEDGENNEA